nr:MAG TPA: hypothetical protein [Caudoviricetes sp.]
MCICFIPLDIGKPNQLALIGLNKLVVIYRNLDGLKIYDDLNHEIP